MLSEERKKEIEAEEKYRSEIKNDLSSKKSSKNKLVAALLAIFLGGLGIHKFYLGRITWGILYLLFCWTFIPAILGLIEGIIYLVMSEDDFEKKYTHGTSNNLGCGSIVLIIIGFFALIIVISVTLFPSNSKSTKDSSTNSKVSNYEFDVPSLIGKDLNELTTEFGAPQGEDPTSLQIQQGIAHWDKTFVKGNKELLVTYNISNNKILDFFVSTDDPSGITQDKPRLLELANAKEDAQEYTVEFVQSLKDSSSYTGIKITPN